MTWWFGIRVWDVTFSRRWRFVSWPSGLWHRVSHHITALCHNPEDHDMKRLPDCPVTRSHNTETWNTESTGAEAPFRRFPMSAGKNIRAQPAAFHSEIEIDVSTCLIQRTWNSQGERFGPCEGYSNTSENIRCDVVVTVLADGIRVLDDTRCVNGALTQLHLRMSGNRLRTDVYWASHILKIKTPITLYNVTAEVNIETINIFSVLCLEIWRNIFVQFIILPL